MANLKYADGVAESTISTGFGDIALAGPIDADHVSFASQFADGDEMPVVVFGGGKRMTFVGRYNSGPNSLTRVTFRSSSTGSNLSLSGTMTVLCGWGAADAAAMLRTDFAQSLSAAQQAQALQNVGIDINQRVNDALDRIYLAKALGQFRRVVNAFADGFRTTAGIASGSSSNYSVDTANGVVSPTSVAGVMISQATGIAIGDMTGDSGIPSAFDGNTAPADASSASISGTPFGSSFIGKNYSSAPKQIGSVIVYPTNASHFCSAGDGVTPVTFNIRGKSTAPSSAIDGTIIGTTGSFLEDGVSHTITSTDLSTSWNYVWVEFINGSNTGTKYIGEIQFFLPATINNETLVGLMQTADASVSVARVVIDYDAQVLLTPGTDFTIEATCNGGISWTAAVAYNLGTGNGQNGRRSMETNEIACTAGTSFSYRIKTLTNKSFPLHGVGISAR